MRGEQEFDSEEEEQEEELGVRRNGGRSSNVVPRELEEGRPTESQRSEQHFIRSGDDLALAERLVYREGLVQKLLSPGAIWSAMVASFRSWRESRQLLNHSAQMGRIITFKIRPILLQLQNSAAMSQENVEKMRGIINECRPEDPRAFSLFQIYRQHVTTLQNTMQFQVQVMQVITSAIRERQLTDALYALQSFVTAGLMRYGVEDVEELVDGYTLRTSQTMEIMHAFDLDDSVVDYSSAPNPKKEGLVKQMMFEFPNLQMSDH